MKSKLQQLLETTWRSPLFGDSYTTTIAYEAFQQKMDALYRRFVTDFTPLIVQGMPDLDTAAQTRFVQEIAPKAAAFCAAVAAESMDLDLLTAATICFGLLYWADSVMDRGDDAMETAVRHYLASARSSAVPISVFPGSDEIRLLPADPLDAVAVELSGEVLPLVRARLATLQHLTTYVNYICRPEDAPYVLRMPILNFLAHEVATRQLSHRYLADDADTFWQQYGPQFATHTIDSTQLAGNAAVIYSLYRQATPALPPLAEVLADPLIYLQMERLGNAALRIFDDVGDQEIDRGTTDWNTFHLNIFNHPNELFICTFLRYATITDELTIAHVIPALQADTGEGDAWMVELFVALLRQHMQMVTQQLGQRSAVFLRLAKRFLEAGYINAVGDTALVDEALGRGADGRPYP